MPIGKFGIGKLSTYVLASKLTHISKSGNTYYAATMDYSRMVGDAKGVFPQETITIPLRTLTEEEARIAVQPWTQGDKVGYRSLRLFGDDATESWTVAIMSGLKEMGQKVSIGRLRWILRTAMPQRSDFRLFLDGDPITPPDIDDPLEKIVIGKDIVEMPKPFKHEVIAREDPKEPEDSVHRYGVYHEDLLGRITGYIEIFKEDIDTGKPKFEGSTGFFVYVRGRRVNVDDPGFGIERNMLRHGTFSRFRMVVHIDSLDTALRSSRESFQQGDLYKAVQNFLRAGFNLARNRLVEYDQTQTPAARMSARISSAPGSLTRKPLLYLARLVAEKNATPFYFQFPEGLSAEEWADFLKELELTIVGKNGLLSSTELYALDSNNGIAVFDVQHKKLLINSSHPFVAAFQELFTDSNTRLALEMLVVSEVLNEANLYHMDMDEGDIQDVINRRDEMLRQFAMSSRRTAGIIALALEDARDDKNKLEEEMRAAFEAMGFDNVVQIGGSGEPDGVAEAHLAARKDGEKRRYRVGLEAKSGGRVSAKRLNVSGILRHMDKHKCDHHVVIGNSFATSTGDDSASVEEIRRLRNDAKLRGEERTVTLMHIEDLARLVRIASAKRVGGLSRIREFFRNCITPEETCKWIDDLQAEQPTNWPYADILDTIWNLAKEQPYEPVEYVAVIIELRHCKPPIKLKKQELIDCCRAMQVMARGVVFAYRNTVEIDRRPDLILDDIRAAVGQFPEDERKSIQI